MNLRSEWFKHVSDTHKKLKRKNKETTRRDAMKAASETWPKVKIKLERKAKRERKKLDAEKETSAVSV